MSLSGKYVIGTGYSAPEAQSPIGFFGVVKAGVGGEFYLVELFMKEGSTTPNPQKLFSLDEMLSWVFYDTEAEVTTAINAAEVMSKGGSPCP